MVYSAGESLWARRALLNDFQRNALTVTFANQADSTVLVTRDLLGVNVMPLAPSFTISGDPFSPLLSWTLPDGTDIDIDRVGLVFYDDDTNIEIGTRVFRQGTTTSYQIQSVLPEGLNLVFNLRFFDLDDRVVPGSTDWTNADILSQSRSFLAYTVPSRVPDTCLDRGQRRATSASFRLASSALAEDDAMGRSALRTIKRGPNGRIHRQPQDVLSRLIQGRHFQRVLSRKRLHGQAPQRVPDQHVRRGQSARLEQAPEFFCDDGQEPRPFAAEVSDSTLD